jgi:hypothetical protein
MKTTQGPQSVGLALLTFIFMSLVFKSLELWLRIHGDLVFFLVAGCASLAFVVTVNEKPITKIVWSIVFLVFLIGAFFLSLSQLDLSFDGNWYQKEAILQISRGWNPFLDGPLTTKVTSESMILAINCYSKGEWLVGSLFYSALGKIEAAKASHLILIFATYFVSVGLLQVLFLDNKKYLQWLLSLAVALNPVSIYQMFTLYADGQLASAFTLSALFLTLLFLTGDFFAYAGCVMSLVYLVSLKSTGLVYAVILLFTFIVSFYFYRRDQFKKSLLTVAAVFILIVGSSFNPYVTSLIRYGSPFYPFNSESSFWGVTTPTGYIYGNLPVTYRGMNRFEKPLYSVFSESNNGEPKIKMPFLVRNGEAGVFWNNDIKNGGFGPLFSGALVLSCIALIFMTRRIGAFIWWPVAVIAITIFIVPEGSWARYVPQFYLILPYALIILLRDKSSTLLKSILALALGGVLFVNAGTIAENNLRHQIGLSSALDQTLNQLKGEKVFADFDIFEPLRSRLDEYGIHYEKIPHNSMLGAKGIRLGGEMTVYPIH